MKKNIEKILNFWLERAKEDLSSAKVMLKAHRYTWCAFICQQALEKCLKAGYVKKKRQIPPYIHKLERLCHLLELEPPTNLLQNIIKIDKYYIATRYPVYKEAINVSSYRKTEEIYLQTKEIYNWLWKELKFPK